MQQQVTKEGEDDADLFGKYMFYCRRGRKAMQAAIEEAEKTDLDALKDTIEGEKGTTEEMKDQIHEEEVKELDAEKAIEKAKKLRDYEAVVFAEESERLHKEIEVMKDTIFKLDRGDELPAASIAMFKQLSGSGDMKSSDRERLGVFLEQIHSGTTMPDASESRELADDMISALKRK